MVLYEYHKKRKVGFTMKLNKKLACAAIAAAMSLSSVAALAAVPVPKDNVQAFIYAEKYFNEGLYYEAQEELSYVAPVYPYEAEKLTVWTDKVQEKITDWEITELFMAIEAAYNANDVLAARAALATLNANYAFKMDYWENEAAKAWANTLAVLTKDAQAIVEVEKVAGKLWDPTLYYSVVKVANGFDVYVKSYDTNHNVACWNVDRVTGAVTVDVTDWNGNPAAEYEWRSGICLR